MNEMNRFFYLPAENVAWTGDTGDIDTTENVVWVDDTQGTDRVGVRGICRLSEAVS